MRPVDLSHPWDSNALTFWGLEPPNVYPTHQIGVGGSQTFMQRYETSMHIGTHFDAPIHIVPQGADLASVPLDVLFGNGVIVDISDDVGELGIITPAHLTQKLEIRKRDI